MLPPVALATAGLAVRVSSVTSHAPRSVLRTRRVLTCPGTCSTSAVWLSVPIPSVRLCAWTSAFCSHASPVRPTGSTLACTIVWSTSPPSVLSFLTLSPMASPAALASSGWPLLTVVTVTPSTNLRVSTTARGTFCSSRVRVSTSNPPSSLRVTLFSVTTPPAASVTCVKPGSASTASVSACSCMNFVLRHTRLNHPAIRAKVVIVWFQSPPSVFSFRTLPSPSPSSAFDAWLRFTVTVRVPRCVRVVSDTAPDTGFSCTVSLITSVVQSSFLRSWRRTITPPPALAICPVPCTFCCFTPRCCSSYLFSKVVSADS